jgi:hypothetical protein
MRGLFSNSYNRRTMILSAAFAMLWGKYDPSFQARVNGR